MNHPKYIIEKLVSEITADDFSFYYGTRPDQNFDADEMKYPACFMDAVSFKVDHKQNNIRHYSGTITLFWAYKTDLDNTSSEKLDSIHAKCVLACKQLALKIRLEDEYVLMSDESLTDVNNVFDINLSGILQSFVLTIKDTTSNCI